MTDSSSIETVTPAPHILVNTVRNDLGTQASTFVVKAAHEWSYEGSRPVVSLQPVVSGIGNIYISLADMEELATKARELFA